MRRNDRFRTVVAGECRQRREARRAKAHRMPALPAMKRRRHRGTVRDRRGDARDRGPIRSTACRPGRRSSRRRPRVARTPHARLAPIPASAFAQRTTRAPAAPSAAASAASSGRTTATTLRHDREEIPARQHADAFARGAGRAIACRRIGARVRAGTDPRQQLVAAEPFAAPRREQNAHDTGSGARRHCAIARTLAIRHAPRPRVPTTTPTGNCSRRAIPSRRRPRR